MRRLLIAAAIVAAATATVAVLTLPPSTLALPPAADGTVRGILHIHTNRSDGRSSPAEIAAAAARSGAQFIVFTDHGDATRTPDAPVYRAGVLCLDGVEISTAGGHYIALDMPAAPYPLAGEPRDVVEDVKRLGGFGIVAHPDSPKRELRWGDWNAPVDAVEWINPDTSWRVLAAAGWGSRFRLLGGLLHYPFRPEEAIAHLLNRFEETMSRWNAAANHRPVVGVAGVDAHANLSLRSADPVDTRYSIPLPGYDASFRMLSVHVRPDTPLSGDASRDAAVVMRAIRAGHLYVAVDAIAGPPSFEFSATNAAGTAGSGDELRAAGPVSLRVRSNAPQGFTTIVWRGDEQLISAEGSELAVDGDEKPAVYRVEIRTPVSDGSRTWLLSNPVYVRAPEVAPAGGEPAGPGALTLALFDGQTEAGWHLEADETSKASVEVAAEPGGAALRLRYTLASDPALSPWAALVWGTPIGHAPVNVAHYDRLTFTAAADGPTRISVQLRTLDVGRPMRRWQRSVYLDTADRAHTVYFKDLVPSPGTETPAPPLEEVTQILFVVDTTNTKAGTSGGIRLGAAALEK